MRILADHPEIDDKDPLDGLAWADDDPTPDPFCTWCGGECERWIMRDGVAVKAPCPNCGEDD